MNTSLFWVVLGDNCCMRLYCTHITTQCYVTKPFTNILCHNISQKLTIWWYKKLVATYTINVSVSSKLYLELFLKINGLVEK